MTALSVWKNEACTEKPNGVCSVLFVRFHRAAGFGDEHLWGGYDDTDNMLFVFTPTDDAPDETYQLRGYRNFLSEERREPFKAGDVVRIENLLEAVDTTNFKTVFKL